MNIQDFLLQIEDGVKNTICIDFDGVVHDHNLGFHDGSIYGSPLEGALESIKTLSMQYKVVIYTCKANPNRPLVAGKTGVELIWEWLEKYNVKEYIHSITFNKPNAVAYIDDKAIRFENWNQALKQLNSLK